MIKKQKKYKSGFSILELMIAVFVLTIGIVGALQLISSTIRVSIDTRNSVIASGLAQEGVELVRNIRDNIMLSQLANISEDFGFKDVKGFPAMNLSCFLDHTFRYDSPTTVCWPYFGGDSNRLYMSNLGPMGSGLYHHVQSVGDVETPFRRFVNFAYQPNDTDPNPTGINIVSYVWWDGNQNPPALCTLANRCVETREYLPKRD